MVGDISARKAVAPLTVSAADARNIFASNCSRCHGEIGQADGPDTALLGVEIPNFSDADFQNSRSDEALKEVISKGGYATGLSPLMPPWDEVLAQEELDALVDYIRDLKQE